MGVFNNFPYANFHELNADWIIEQVRKVTDEWEEYRTDMNLWKLGVDDQLAAFQAWFDNLDVQDEVRTVINELIQSGEFIEIAGPQIVSATEAWLAAHITPTTPAVDDTLSISGAAADAKATGDRITDLKEDLNETVFNKYTFIQPTNRLNLDAITDDKILLADGTEVNSSSHCYSDYISCNEGDVVYLRYNGYLEAYRRAIACYNSSKEVLPSKGSNESSLSPFTIPSGVSFFRITMNKADKTHNVVTINQTVNSYVPYEPPYYKITEDFLTEETKTIIDGIGGNNHGCSLPKMRLRMTVGIGEKWYKSNMVTPPADFVNVNAGIGYSKNVNDGVEFPNINALDSEIYFKWQHYNDSLVWLSDQGINSQYGLARKIISENLSNCSLLVIGDSTVDQDTMTGTMLNYFSSKGKTLTLLGTLGDGTPNNHNEGRAGWKATDYLTNKQYNGVVNPFYNPSTQTFDFTYYMTNQGYTSPDFVVIQLGINDLYYDYTSAINTTWNAIKTMIDSIIAYNSSIKIFMNLPTPPNADDSKLSNVGFLYRNAVIKYAEYAINQNNSLYGGAKVRPTYCHLILDPNTDIRDDVHPTNDGYTKMGMEVINQINCWQNGV